MKKLLLTSICAAALSSTASAFTLDLAQLNGDVLGTGVINMPGIGSFTVNGTTPASAFISGGVATINNGQSFSVIYPANTTYVGALTGASLNVVDNGSQVTFTATADGATASNLNFNQTAVPEPSSTALLGLGGLALILRRRK